MVVGIVGNKAFTLGRTYLSEEGFVKLDTGPSLPVGSIEGRSDNPQDWPLSRVPARAALGREFPTSPRSILERISPVHINPRKSKPDRF